MIESTRFPVLEQRIWLNHAAISPWPAAVIEAMRDFVEDNAAYGALHYPDWLETEQRLRQRACRLLGAELEDLALVKNTSDGLCLIAAGLDWQPGDAVVCSAGEFPSNLLPWQQLPPAYVERRLVAFDPEDPEAALIAALDARARVLAVSSVRYDSGVRLDLKRLAAACSAHDTLLVVDAIQHLGALALDVAELQADFVVGGSHKWLLAPEGLALFWSRPAARAQLKPVQTGWRMWPDMFNFERPDWTPPSTARRFEPGTLNNAGIVGLEAALGLLLETNPSTREHQLLERSGHLLHGLSQLPKVKLHTPIDDARRAGIVCFEAEGIDPRELHTTLTEAGIFSAIRGRALRLSPHFYTPESQLDQALEVIASSVARG